MLRLLGVEPDKMRSPEREFLCPERVRLEAELKLPIGHSRRAFIGDRLAELGDTRRGVGLRPDMLPDIDWCHVPGGSVRIGLTGNRFEVFEVEPFYIARYVVTVSQFTAFAMNEAYRDDEWWKGLPMEPSERAPVQQYPPVPNHPADLVSWYQAIAYCRWLSRALGYNVRLPTEWEWQQAAVAGNPTLLYPWGTEWHSDYANTKEGGVGRLVSVGLYPQGASPVGAMDMSGNMYEWCQNPYDDPKSKSVRKEPRTSSRRRVFPFRGARSP